MRVSFLQRFVVTAVLSLVAAAVLAQAQPAKKKDEFQPYSGQEGKDVVWVPTSQALVNRMLDMAKVTPADLVMDLGSGDGRTVITAAKRGAKAIGVEYNPDMVALSRRNAAKEGVTDKAQFIHGDIFETDFSKANVVTLFLLPELNVKLRPKILDMKPGTRIVSNSFTMGDWQSDQTQNVSEKEGCSAYCTAYLWIVPAKVDGKWKTPAGELTLKQTYQNLSGSLGANQITKGVVRSDTINFTAGGVQYTGKVHGDTITGTAKNGTSSNAFTATRAGA